MLLLVSPMALGQVSIADSAIVMGLANVTYGGFVPAGDYAQRAGFTNLMGGEIGIKLKRNFFALTGAYFLLSDVSKEESMLDGLAFTYRFQNTNGSVSIAYGFIDANGNVHQPSFTVQGFAVPLKFGYIFNQLKFSKKENPNSGPFIAIGGQFIQHKVSFKLGSDQIPWNDKSYLRGYDRLTNGFGLLQSIGYQYFSNQRFLNFNIAFEASQHFTQNRRPLNFDTNTVDNRRRMDILWGFRVGWSLPLYNVAAEKFYYY
jgi:hypothetical protein